MRFFRYLKEKVFSRKSGLRHLAALLLTALVLAMTHVGMTLLTGEEHWFHELYWELFLGKNEQMLYGAIGVLIGAAALMGGFLRRCGESWLVRFFQRFFYSLLGAVPIVNLIVPLIYQHRRKKQGREQFVSDGTFRSTLESETYYALVTNNIVLKPDGKLKFGIIRFVFAATFRLIGGVFLLLIALLVIGLAPGVTVFLFAASALITQYYPEALYWVGMAALGLVALIDVVHPLIALIVNPRRKTAAPAAVYSGPEPVTAPDYPDEEPADPVLQEPVFEPEPEPEPEDEDDAMALAIAGACPDEYPSGENGQGREVHNHKEMIL